MTTVLSQYSYTVSKFFQETSWSGSNSLVSDGSTAQSTSSTDSTNWSCTSIQSFFQNMDWTQRYKTIASSTYTSVTVAHPIAMPVGRFFREFAQVSSSRS